MGQSKGNALTICTPIKLGILLYRIYCGYENMIEIFDVHAPGNNTSTKISTTPNRKSRKGQKGIVSCLDFNPDQSGMYAAGSYSNSIGIYDERTDELCLKLTGMKGNGITQVKFSLDGHLLYSASRQSNSILCWDVRQSGNILYDLHRKGKTNQRITFDLDPTGSVLITGEQVNVSQDIIDCPTDLPSLLFPGWLRAGL